MTSELSIERARAFCRALKADTRGKPMGWRGIAPIARAAKIEDPDDAIATAEGEGWIEVEGNHSVCLTDAGRRLQNELPET